MPNTSDRSAEPEFRVEVDQNPYLPLGGEEVHAVALAHESGNEETEKLLGRVVDVIDPVIGTVRLKPGVDKVDEMTLDTNSTRTVRTRPRVDGPGTRGVPGPG